jgi:hypothetical protein
VEKKFLNFLGVIAGLIGIAAVVASFQIMADPEESLRKAFGGLLVSAVFLAGSVVYFKTSRRPSKPRPDAATGFLRILLAIPIMLNIFLAVFGANAFFMIETAEDGPSLIAMFAGIVGAAAWGRLFQGFANNQRTIFDWLILAAFGLMLVAVVAVLLSFRGAADQSSLPVALASVYLFFVTVAGLLSIPAFLGYDGNRGQRLRSSSGDENFDFDPRRFFDEPPAGEHGGERWSDPKSHGLKTPASGSFSGGEWTDGNRHTDSPGHTRQAQSASPNERPGSAGGNPPRSFMETGPAGNQGARAGSGNGPPRGSYYYERHYRYEFRETRRWSSGTAPQQERGGAQQPPPQRPEAAPPGTPQIGYIRRPKGYSSDEAVRMYEASGVKDNPGHTRAAEALAHCLIRAVGEKNGRRFLDSASKDDRLPKQIRHAYIHAAQVMGRS